MRDELTGARESLSLRTEVGASFVPLELAPGESCLLEESEEQLPPHRTRAKRLEDCKTALDLSGGWMRALAPAADPPVFGAAEAVDSLRPVSEDHPAFSGLIRYEKRFVLDSAPEEAWFLPEQVFESLHLTVNGADAGVCLAPPYALEISRYLRSGENTVVAEVATTPARDQLNMPQPPFDFYHEALEAAGMFRTVILKLK